MATDFLLNILNVEELKLSKKIFVNWTWSLCKIIMQLRTEIMTKIIFENINWNLSKTRNVGPMPNVMAALPNTGGTLCSTTQSLAEAHYYSAVQ